MLFMFKTKTSCIIPILWVLLSWFDTSRHSSVGKIFHMEFKMQTSENYTKLQKSLLSFFSFFLELEKLSFPYAYTDDPVLSSDR